MSGRHEPFQGRPREIKLPMRAEILLAARMLADRVHRTSPPISDDYSAAELWLADVVEAAVVERFEEAYQRRLGDVLGRVQNTPRNGGRGNAREVHAQLELGSRAFARKVAAAVSGRAVAL